MPRAPRHPGHPRIENGPATASQPAVGRSVIVGRPGDIPRALEHPAVLSLRGMAVAGVVTIDEAAPGHANRGAELDELLRRVKADTVLVAGPVGAGTMRIVTDMALLNGLRVVSVMPSETVAGHDPVIVWEGERPLVQLVGARRTSGAVVVKRMIDLIGAAVSLLALAPILALIALLVRLDSAGPIFFGHLRMGAGAQPFRMLKFRTMVADAEEWLARDPELARLYRENDFRLPDEIDPRLTRLGRILRRTSIDELPQLWNVIRGEMSLVGPRPIEAAELEHYAGSERLLLSVRPGLTGLWAVMGRHAVFHPQRADLELQYVRTWSLAGDWRIIFQTFRALTRYGPTDR